MTFSAVVEALHRVEKKASLALWSPHKLKHTFCWHLAMRGVAPVVIKELAAHQHLATTMRYLHLTPGAADGAIRLLDRATGAPARGEIVETEDPAI